MKTKRIGRMVAAAAVMAAVMAMFEGAHAHGGGVDAQGCHAVKATGERHCHVERDGQRFKLVIAPVPECPEPEPVERIVTVERPIKPECAQLRAEFNYEREMWLGDPVTVARRAIAAGCW